MSSLLDATVKPEGFIKGQSANKVYNFRGTVPVSLSELSFLLVAVDEEERSVCVGRPTGRQCFLKFPSLQVCKRLSQ